MHCPSTESLQAPALNPRTSRVDEYCLFLPQGSGQVSVRVGKVIQGTNVTVASLATGASRIVSPVTAALSAA